MSDDSDYDYFEDNDLNWGMITMGISNSNSSVSVKSGSAEIEKPFGFYLCMQGMLVVLNSCLEELTLLKRILNTAVDKSWNNVVTYQPIEERFGGARELVFEESEFDRLTDRQKFQKDICFVYNILREGFDEISRENTFESVTSAIDAMNHLTEEENVLLKEEAENSQGLRFMKMNLHRDKKYYLKAIQDRKYELFKLKDQYEDILVYGKYKVKYINAWEGSRTFQKHLLMTQIENKYKKMIDDSKSKMDMEIRIHSEIATYLNSNNEDMTDEIAYWAKHYEEERDRRDLEIYNLKSARDQIIERLEETKVLFIKHKEEIEQWLEEKEIKCQAEALLRKQIIAVIMIQAWWRGQMVRWHLGPYRKKKKGKGEKKEKRKKKK